MSSVSSRLVTKANCLWKMSLYSFPLELFAVRVLPVFLKRVFKPTWDHKRETVILGEFQTRNNLQDSLLSKPTRIFSYSSSHERVGS